MRRQGLFQRLVPRSGGGRQMRPDAGGVDRRQGPERRELGADVALADMPVDVLQAVIRDD